MRSLAILCAICLALALVTATASAQVAYMPQYVPGTLTQGPAYYVPTYRPWHPGMHLGRATVALCGGYVPPRYGWGVMPTYQWRPLPQQPLPPASPAAPAQ